MSTIQEGVFEHWQLIAGATSNDAEFCVAGLIGDKWETSSLFRLDQIQVSSAFLIEVDGRGKTVKIELAKPCKGPQMLSHDEGDCQKVWCIAYRGPFWPPKAI